MNEVPEKIVKLLRLNLAAELGTFEGGKVAIAVEPPQAPKTGTGLHCYVDRYPQQQSNQVYQHRVILTQYDATEAGIAKLDSAIQKMRQLFTNAREIIPPYRENRPSRAIYIVPCYATMQPSVFSVPF